MTANSAGKQQGGVLELLSRFYKRDFCFVTARFYTKFAKSLLMNFYDSLKSEFNFLKFQIIFSFTFSSFEKISPEYTSNW